jgi:hypothetical protein
MTTTDTDTGTGVRVRGSHAPIVESERAALADAERLAELWDTALQASYRLGYHTGHQRGLIAGRHEEATAWQAIVTGYAAVLAAPTRAELARARQPSNDPCSSRCGSCSRCTRAAAVTRNLARYGVPDYPGTARRQHGTRRP